MENRFDKNQSQLQFQKSISITKIKVDKPIIYMLKTL
jgi:hypothetical protein